MTKPTGSGHIRSLITAAFQSCYLAMSRGFSEAKESCTFLPWASDHPQDITLALLLFRPEVQVWTPLQVQNLPLIKTVGPKSVDTEAGPVCPSFHIHSHNVKNAAIGQDAPKHIANWLIYHSGGPAINNYDPIIKWVTLYSESCLTTQSQWLDLELNALQRGSISNMHLQHDHDDTPFIFEYCQYDFTFRDNLASRKGAMEYGIGMGGGEQRCSKISCIKKPFRV